MVELVINPEHQLAGGYLLWIIGGLMILSLIFGKSNAEPVEEDENTKRMRQEKADKKKALKKAIAMRNKYFYKNTATGSIEGPHEKQEIMDMLGKNSINLETPVRKGIEDQNFRKLKDFPELVADVKDFI
jgi:hypothetical protein